MSNLIIKCEIVAGTSIQEAVRQAVWICNNLRVNIEFDFNGRTILISYGDRYNKAIEKALKESVE